MTKILETQYIKTGIEADTWQECVKAVGQILVDQDDVKPAFVDKMIEMVFELGPYMILLPEVALFHAPPGELVNRPSLSLVTLAKPVYFTEFDNQKISCALALAAKDSDSHMEMIQQVAQLLMDETFLEAIRTNQPKEVVEKRLNELVG